MRLILPLVACLVAGASLQADLVLDTFDTPFTLAGTATGANVAAPEVPGGVRALLLTSGSVEATGGVLSLAPGSGSLTLGFGWRWNGAGEIELQRVVRVADKSGADRLRFQLTALTGTVRVYASLIAAGSTLSNGNPGDPVFTLTSPGVNDLLFAQALRAAGGGTVDLRQVDFIALTFQPFVGASFSLGEVSVPLAVPEPATWASGALGLIIALAVQQRMRPRAPRGR
ncbi:MAG: hypothetical protein JSR82_09235 [Verrucomicrobia bacterium]|nr:hypothetical protein [Verrucomicrobiota bacterium]